jgi:folate-binding protein YgfZ
MSTTLLLHGRHSDQGPVPYEPFGPWLVPWQFQGFEAEYQAVRAGAGLIDFSYLASIRVEGADRASFLHRLLSNDILRVAPGTGCRAALLNASGKMLADIGVLADPEALWLLCSVLQADELGQALEKYHFSEQVEITNLERAYGILALAGPKLHDLLQKLIPGTTLPSTFGGHLMTTIKSHEVRLIRMPVAGGASMALMTEAAHLRGVWQALLDAGAAPVGWSAWNAARIEAGLPFYGIDMDASNLLPETGLEAISASSTKGCYIGQEVMARLDTYGSVSQKLMGLKLEGATPVRTGAQILHAGQLSGRITSAAYSPALKCQIAMGYVKRGAYEPGTKVDVADGSVRTAATVMNRPLVDVTPASTSGTRACA